MKKYLSIGNIICGILTFALLAATISLFAQVEASMPLIKSAVVITDGKVLPENEGKLVLVSGNVTADGSIVRDPVFDVTVQSPYLERIVEVFQWEEDSDGDSYMEWSRKISYSSTSNPRSKPFDDMSFYSTAKVGEFELSPEHLDKLSEIAVDVKDLEPSYDANIDTFNTYYYYSTDPSSAFSLIGDAIITFRMIDPAHLGRITVLAKQEGGRLTDYNAAENKYPINYLFHGVLSFDEVLAQVESDNKMGKIVSIILTVLFAGLTVLFTKRRISRYKARMEMR